jgi:hypothetical protein
VKCVPTRPRIRGYTAARWGGVGKSIAGNRLQQLGPRNCREGVRKEVIVDHFLKRQVGKDVLSHSAYRFDGDDVVLGTVVHAGRDLDPVVVKRHKHLVCQGRRQENELLYPRGVLARLYIAAISPPRLEPIKTRFDVASSRASNWVMRAASGPLKSGVMISGKSCLR